jgi:hypothetical protein
MKITQVISLFVYKGCCVLDDCFKKCLFFAWHKQM